jgi:hypothetical protein
VIDDGGWLGVATEVWTGFGGAVLGAVVGGWSANRSAAKERLLNRVTRLLELYQEHGHQLLDVDSAIDAYYMSIQEHDAAAKAKRQAASPSPVERLSELERQLRVYMGTFRLIATHDTDPRRTVPLEGLSKHLIAEVGAIGRRDMAEAQREQLRRCQYATHLRNAVLELMHHLPQIPPLSFWGKIRWEGARHEHSVEVRRLQEFTERVVNEKLEADRKASIAASKANPSQQR